MIHLTQPTTSEEPTMTTHRWRVPLALVLAFGLTAAACGSDDDSSESTDTTEAVEGSTIRFAPQDFAESKTLTEVYAQYLEAQGFDVEVEPASGFRDQVYPALEDDQIDIIIDYTGSATRFLDPDATPSANSEETYTALNEALAPLDLVSYDFSQAEDANALVALAAWATENDVTTIGDLAGVESVKLGAAEDCRERADCLIGYQDLYELDFAEFVALEYGPPLTEALKADEVQVAQYQTTAPQLATGDFVSLEDNLGLFAADNIVPVLRSDLADEYGAALAAAVNEISALITTDDLIAWNVSTDIDKEEPADVATAWLEEKGLL
jgi:osmoprotectant transport system substrate-binding protein